MDGVQGADSGVVLRGQVQVFKSLKKYILQWGYDSSPLHSVTVFFFLNVNTVEADVSNMLTMSIAC